MYENYTLLELIYIMNKHKIKIDCEWNKRSIIKMLKNRGIYLFVKQGPLKLTKWNCYVREDVNMIYVPGMGFQLYQGCVFKLSDGTVYEIEGLFEDRDMYVCLYNYGLKCVDKMLVNEFMKLLDYDDVTIQQYRHGKYYMSKEEEIFWEKRNGMILTI